MGKRRLRNVFQAAVAMVLSISLLVSEVPVWAAEGENVQYDSIDGLSGEILYDTSGKRVMACGGEVHQFTENGVTKWYWFGVDDLEKNDGEQKEEGIHLYSSSDLYNWDYEGVMWDIEGSAHPKMLYNQEQKQYVMWVSNAQGKVSVAVSSSIKGPFQTVNDSAADNNIAGFFNLYEEKPGTAYVIYSNSSFSGFKVAQLSSDYMSIEGQENDMQFEGNLLNAEGGIFKRDNKYYIVNAGMSQYAVADSLTGTWKVCTLQMWDGTDYKDIVNKNQTSSVFRVKTETAEEYVCIGDSVGGESGKVRFIWLPLVFSEGDKVTLRELSNWKLDNIVPEEPVIPPEIQEYDSIDGLSGEILYDTDGERVYACGGEVHQFTEDGETKWYWFGVNDLETDGQKNHPGIHLYSSTDLYNWKHEGTIADFGMDYSIAHPKVLYNEAQKKYVMWVSTGQGIVVATGESIKGPFTAVGNGGLSGLSGFVNLYQDSDGKAYILYPNGGVQSGNSSICMAELSQDYTRIEGTPQALPFTGENGLFAAEGGIFERNGKYYIVNAGSPDGFGPQYAVADSLNGPWTLLNMQMWDNEKQLFEDITEKNQTSDVFHVKTETIDTFVCMGDSVGGESGKVRYIWLPIKFFEDGTIALEKLSNWKLDRKDEEGEQQLATEADKAALADYINEFVAGIIDDTEYEVSYPAAVRNTFAADVAQVKGKTIKTLQDIEDAKQELQRAAEALKEAYIRPYDGKTIDIQALEAQITAAGNLLTEANKAKDEKAYNTLKTARETAQTAKNTALATEVTKAQVVGAAAALQEAIATFNNALEVADARIELAEAIAKAEEIMAQEQYFTKDSWQEFKEAYEAAKDVTPTMTADEINKAVADLIAAQEQLLPVRPVEITGVKLDKATLNLKIGETAALRATIEPADAMTDKTLEWISDRTDTAKVNHEGIVTGVGAGTAYITVSTKNGKKDVCKVEVTAPVEETPSGDVKVSLDKTAVTLAAETEITLLATVTPVNAGAIVWSSSDDKIARVIDGKVKAEKAGTARITATVGNKTATCTVTVVSLSETKLTLGEKESITLRVNGTDKNVTWSTSNKKAATVKNGKVTAKKADKKAVIITANVDGATLTCKVTVKAAPKKLILKSKKTIAIKRKKKVQLKVSLPKNTAGTLKYKTSNKKVATVDSKGKVKGIKKGTAKITVTAANNKKAKVIVTVKVK